MGHRFILKDKTMNTTATLNGVSATMACAFALALTQHPAAAQTAYPPLPMAPPASGAHAGGGRGMGNVTLAQFQMRQRNRLMKADTDHDGRISLAEWTAWQEAHPGPNGVHGDSPLSL